MIKRNLLKFGVVAILSISMVGCGSKNEESKPVETTTSVEEVTTEEVTTEETTTEEATTEEVTTEEATTEETTTEQITTEQVDEYQAVIDRVHWYMEEPYCTKELIRNCLLDDGYSEELVDYGIENAEGWGEQAYYFAVSNSYSSKDELLSYLIDELGFSQDEANYAAEKVGFK